MQVFGAALDMCVLACKRHMCPYAACVHAHLSQVHEFIIIHGMVRVCKTHKVLGLFELEVRD